MRFNEMTKSSHKCPHCGGPMFSEMLMMEKKDACYYKVKASAKVWPSAYASGRLVQCRKKGAANYGNKSESVAEGTAETPQQQQVRAAINKGMEKWDQNDKATYQSQPTKTNYMPASGYASDKLTGVDSIDPDGTVVLAINDTKADGIVKKLATLGGMPGVKTRQIQPKIVQGMAENIRVEPVARPLKTQSTQTQPKQNVYVAPDKKTPAVVNHIKQKGLAEGWKTGAAIGGGLGAIGGGPIGAIVGAGIGGVAQHLSDKEKDEKRKKEYELAKIEAKKGIPTKHFIETVKQLQTKNLTPSEIAHIIWGSDELGQPRGLRDNFSSLDYIIVNDLFDKAGYEWDDAGRLIINTVNRSTPSIVKPYDKWGDEIKEQGMAEGKVTKTTTGLRHRATDKYGAGDDEPHHYTGGRSGFSNPGKYARDLEHVNKQLVKDLDASMGISWKNRGTKGVAEDYNPEYDDEAGMADNNLETLHRAVDGIDDVINTGDNLPEWCQEKIAVAKSMLVSVWDYMRSEQDRGANPELAEEFDLIESCIDRIADHNGVDAEMIWEDLESLSHDELYVFAVTSEPIMEDWQKANKKDRTAGMSQKAVNAYRRENPGSKLQTAVTTKPSKLKKGSKSSKRRKSYCSRSRGQMKMHNISCAKTPDKAICKARRRWNC